MRLQAGGPIDLVAGGILRARGIEIELDRQQRERWRDRARRRHVDHPSRRDRSRRRRRRRRRQPHHPGRHQHALSRNPIDATGGAGDGGDVDLFAATTSRSRSGIDVSSNSGGGSGDIRVRAGIDRAGGVKVGGSLTIPADLNANGSSDIDGGYDGGEINLSAFGPVNISGTLRAVGANPNGGGGSVIIDSSDNVPNRVTALDGDLTLSSIIDVHGPQTISNEDSGAGGDIDIFIGRNGTITGSMDLSGSDGGGTLNV